MSHNPRQPSPQPEFQQPPPKSNKKLWLILGGVAGALIILMGGCAACAALIGISTLNNSVQPNSSPAPAAADSARAGAEPAGRDASDSATLAGTWEGTVSCDTGGQLPAVLKVAATGNPIYEYQTKSGQREVELRSAGQTLRFGPPEGGVADVRVDSLSVTPNEISYAMSISEERSGGGTLTQSSASILMEAARSGAELEVRMTLRSNSVASQPGFVVPGEESTATCRGKLRRR